MADEQKKDAPETEETPVEQAEEAATEADKPAQEPEAEKTEEPKAEEAEEAKTEETADTEPAQEEPAAEEKAEEVEEEVEEVKIESAFGHIVPGMIVRVHVKIKDVTPRGDERERIQVFEGTVIAKKGRDAQSATITVRKISGGVGVERIFPLMMPAIEKIEVVKQFRTRRSKLYFLRGKYKKRMKEVLLKEKS